MTSHESLSNSIAIDTNSSTATHLNESKDDSGNTSRNVNRMPSKPQTLDLNCLTPAIQIDLVPTRTPTPEEPEDTSWMEQQAQRAMNRRKIRVKIIQEEDEDEVDDDNETSSVEVIQTHFANQQQESNQFNNQFNISCNESNNNLIDKHFVSNDITVNSTAREHDEEAEIREVARHFVSNVIDKARSVAQSRIARDTSRSSDLYSETCGKRHLHPWFLRIRQLISRLMRSACLCKSKMPPSSATCNSIVDHA